VRALRRLLAATFLAGAIGTGAELLLLEHTEDVWQQLPLWLLAAGCLLFVLAWLRPHPATLRVLGVVMLLFLVSGVVGVWLHYEGNVEFEREIDPAAAGLTLMWDALGGATPALAPGTMALLGAVGFAYARAAVSGPE
jgi:hypothetical protein